MLTKTKKILIEDWHYKCHLKLIWINNNLTFEQMMSERSFSVMTFKLCQYRFFCIYQLDFGIQLDYKNKIELKYRS